MIENQVKYVRAHPDFVDLDTEEDGLKFLSYIESQCEVVQPQILVVDIGGCYLDYWGCAPLIAGCMKLISDPNQKMRTLAILTTMEFGMRHSYASLFFKGTDYERNSINKEFIAIAVAACAETSIELKIWITPSNFEYVDMENLKGPRFILSAL